jgi:hypothetical protein
MDAQQAIKFLALIAAEYAGTMKGQPAAAQCVLEKAQVATRVLTAALAPPSAPAPAEDRPRDGAAS